MEFNHPNYGLSKSKEEVNGFEEPWTDEGVDDRLPRAVVRHNAFTLLDGEWRFSIDPDDRGLTESWHLGHNYEAVAMWPGSIETHIAAAKGQQDGVSWHDKV